MVYTVIVCLFTCCRKAEPASSEVRVSLENGDYARVAIYRENGGYAGGVWIDHSQREGRVGVVHVEPGRYGYTAETGNKEVRGSFEKGPAMLTVIIDMR